MEESINDQYRYRFPFIEQMFWYVAEKYIRCVLAEVQLQTKEDSEYDPPKKRQRRDDLENTKNPFELKGKHSSFSKFEKDCLPQLLKWLQRSKHEHPPELLDPDYIISALVAIINSTPIPPKEHGQSHKKGIPRIISTNSDEDEDEDKDDSTYYEIPKKQSNTEQLSIKKRTRSTTRATQTLAHAPMQPLACSNTSINSIHSKENESSQSLQSQSFPFSPCIIPIEVPDITQTPKQLSTFSLSLVAPQLSRAPQPPNACLFFPSTSNHTYLASSNVYRLHPSFFPYQKDSW